MVRVYINIFQGPDSIFEPIKFGRDLVDIDFHASRRTVPVGTLGGPFPIIWRRAERTESIHDHTVGSWDLLEYAFWITLGLNTSLVRLIVRYSEVEHWLHACLVRFTGYLRDCWFTLDRVIDIPDHQGVLTWKAKPVHCSDFWVSTAVQVEYRLRCLQWWRKWITCL